MKKIIFTFSFLISFQTHCLQASWDSLPKEIKLLIVPMIASSNVHEVTKTILALNHTNKFFRNFVRSEIGIFSILHKMPYIQNSIDLAYILGNRQTPYFNFEKNRIWRYYCELRCKLKNGPALASAAKNNNLEKAQNLLRCKYIALNYESFTCFPPSDGPASTPLTLAIDNENEEMIVALIKAGADLNKYNHHYYKPIECTFIRGKKRIVELLIAYGAK